MSQELTDSLIARVRSSYAQFINAGRLAVDSLLDHVNAARETGLFLHELKDATPHGRFGKMFESDHGISNENPAFHFSAEWGRTFMRLADAMPEPITTLPEGYRHLKDVMVLTGALPTPSHGEQTRGDDTGPHTKGQGYVMNMFSIIRKERDKAPVASWPVAVLDGWKGYFDELREFMEEVEKAILEKEEEE